MIAGLGLIDSINQTSFGNGLGGAAGIKPPVAPVSGATSFAAAVEQAGTRTVASMERAEALSLHALQGGQIQARDVVDAVMSAEQSLQAAISIRDKIVTAYLEISRMAI